jgi:hypothetical protein
MRRQDIKYKIYKQTFELFISTSTLQPSVYTLGGYDYFIARNDAHMSSIFFFLSLFENDTDICQNKQLKKEHPCQIYTSLMTVPFRNIHLKQNP